MDLYFTNPEHPLSLQETGGVLVDRAGNTTLSIDSRAAESLTMLFNPGPAHHQGVWVRMVMEVITWIEWAVRLLAAHHQGRSNESLMHNKFMNLDNSIVWTGSINYTYSGVAHNNTGAGLGEMAQPYERTRKCLLDR
jgi:phosphatidylserine/phosphatidylglycerophosphate/cardiolipin synthase-like enzyme